MNFWAPLRGIHGNVMVEVTYLAPKIAKQLEVLYDSRSNEHFPIIAGVRRLQNHVYSHNYVDWRKVT